MSICAGTFVLAGRTGWKSLTSPAQHLPYVNVPGSTVGAVFRGLHVHICVLVLPIPSVHVGLLVNVVTAAMVREVVFYVCEVCVWHSFPIPTHGSAPLPFWLFIFHVNKQCSS